MVNYGNDDDEEEEDNQSNNDDDFFDKEVYLSMEGQGAGYKGEAITKLGRAEFRSTAGGHGPPTGQRPPLDGESGVLASVGRKEKMQNKRNKKVLKKPVCSAGCWHTAQLRTWQARSFQ